MRFFEIDEWHSFNYAISMCILFCIAQSNLTFSNYYRKHVQRPRFFVYLINIDPTVEDKITWVSLCSLLAALAQQHVLSPPVSNIYDILHTKSPLSSTTLSPTLSINLTCALTHTHTHQGLKDRKSLSEQCGEVRAAGLAAGILQDDWDCEGSVGERWRAPLNQFLLNVAPVGT